MQRDEPPPGEWRFRGARESGKADESAASDAVTALAQGPFVSARWREGRSGSTMTADHEAAIRAATDALAAAILAAVRAEAVSNEAGPEQLLSIDRAAVLAGVGRTSIYAAIGAGRLRSVKVGRRRLVPASAIAELATVEQAAPFRPGR
jgi:excisionase family DNA binding protein